jgi:hypothetical protein
MSDFSYFNPPKEQTRQNNLDLVRHYSSRIYSRHHHHLRLDVLDLCGENAPFLQLLLDEQVLGPGRYVGVDVDPDVVARCRTRFASDDVIQWHHGDLVARLRSDTNAWPNVGVLNYDSQRRGSQAPVRQDLRVLASFAKRQWERHGEFLLIVNVTTARDGAPKTVRHLRRVLETEFEGLTLHDDSFHIYTSVGRWQPMVHVRLRLGF